MLGVNLRTHDRRCELPRGRMGSGTNWRVRRRQYLCARAEMMSEHRRGCPSSLSNGIQRARGDAMRGGGAIGVGGASRAGRRGESA